MTRSSDDPISVLAVAAHRDDVEQTCGGTLLKMAEAGHRTAILDLSRGEMGTRGTSADRAREAAEAARILRVAWRGALDLPDGRVENTWENRLKVAAVIRLLRPRALILPYWKGRHPDHYTASKLGYEAAFLAGLKKLETALPDLELANVSEGQRFSAAEISPNQDGASAPEALAPHRPFKILYACLYYDVRPTFVVDITSQFEARFQSLMAYKSQYQDQTEGADLFPAHAEIRARTEAMARFYGLLAGVDYAEPFIQQEVGLVEDVTAIPVRSI
jgi:bacillithiol biosynthesis deacetylase BshB1